MKKKRYIFLICFILFIVGFYNALVSKSSEELWGESCVEVARRNWPSVDEVKIREQCNCIYDGFIVRYKTLENFPNAENYSDLDFENIYDCSVINIASNDSIRSIMVQNKHIAIDLLKRKYKKVEEVDNK